MKWVNLYTLILGAFHKIHSEISVYSFSHLKPFQLAFGEMHPKINGFVKQPVSDLSWGIFHKTTPIKPMAWLSIYFSTIFYLFISLLIHPFNNLLIL